MINLLPPEIKNKERQASRVYSLISFYIIIGSIIALATAGVWTYRFILESQLTDKQGQLSSLESAAKSNSSVLDQAAFIKNRLEAEANYQDSTDWVALLDQIASDTPATIQLTNLHLDRSSSAFSLGINGLASSRRDIVLYKDKLNASSLYMNAEITAVNDRDNASAQPFSFTIQTSVKGGK